MGMYSSMLKENNIEYSNILDILDESYEINAFIEQERLDLC